MVNAMAPWHVATQVPLRHGKCHGIFATPTTPESPPTTPKSTPMTPESTPTTPESTPTTPELTPTTPELTPCHGIKFSFSVKNENYVAT